MEQAVKIVTKLANAKKICISTKSVNQNLNIHDDSLVELLVILLENAVQYSHKDIKIKFKSEVVNGKLKISITDHGIGISETDLPHIFDRFYRADSSRSIRSEKGYGLGLSIASSIVKLYGGTIEVESKLGQGSTFSVYIQI
jgi:two-component system phosphate regulon sensor histidine kinase PhoR